MLLRIHRYSWQDNAEMDLKEIEVRFVNWIHQNQNREWWQVLANVVMMVL